jgi:hypothetical protein
MATGIEMLGQMGTDQSLAGPVQGGNMVVKPNQVPVGGAAMLSKALRGQADKGVGGMYVLPEQEDQTPDFMKIAKSNVMRDVNGRRNQFPGNFSEAEGGIIPMLPRNLKTAPGADETTLAYITPEEQAVLGLLNPGTPHRGPEQVPTYDSVDWNPNTGQYDVTSGTQASQYETSAGASGTPQQQQQAAEAAGINWDTYTGAGLGEGQAYAFDPETYDPITTTGPTSTQVKPLIIQGATSEVNNQQNEVDKAEKALAEAKEKGSKKDISFAEKALTKAKNIFETLASAAKSKFFPDDDEGRYSDIEKDYKIKALKKKYPGLSDREIERLFVDPGANPTIMGSIGDWLSKPKPDQMTDENYMAIMEDARKIGGVTGMSGTGGDIDEFWMDQYSYEHGPIMAEGLKDLPKSERDAILKDSSSFKDYMKTMSSGYKGKEDYKGSEAQRRADKADYYSGTTPQTSGGLEQLAGETTFTKADMENMTAEQKGKAKSFNQKVFNARETAGRNRGEQRGQRPGGMGGGAGPVIEDEVTEAVVEEGATTMPYTGPRTGGAEVNVPLSRRFALDPTQDVAQYKTAPRSTEDIYKYFTEGTTGEGRMLEPYGEFQKRRRKALGKEPLDFWSY